MNRETEFRGLRTDGKGWVYGGVVYGKSGKVYIFQGNDDDFIEDDCCEVIPESVGEFTGKYDKNEVKIFEDDIISSHHFYDQCGKEYFLNHIIKWSDKYCGWFALNSESKNEIDGCIQLFVYIKNAASQVIIGNIHENK